MEKEQKNKPDFDSILEEADKAEGVFIDRITETLTIDGFTHPSKKNVAKELRKLNVRKLKRNKPTKHI